ncbi:MAG: Na+/H+ antiporter subunit E [Burkholderiales bacterium]
MMKRLVPAPVLSLSLFALWLLLNQSISAGHFVIGIVVAVAMPLLAAPFRPVAAVRIRRPSVLLRLVFAVGWDVVMSNIKVGWDVLRYLGRKPASAFVRIPLELRDANALAALAIITTVIPGTVWCELALDRSAVLLHVWDLEDEATFIAHYKSRYEQRLMEIFQ